MSRVILTPAQKKLADDLRRAVGVVLSGDEEKAFKMLRSAGLVRIETDDNQQLRSNSGN